MCVIIEKTPGQTFPAQKIKSACKTNRDGFGYMYVCPETNRIVVNKVLTSSAEEAAEKINQLFEELKNLHVIFHLRYGTHGARSEANVHPFQVLNKEEHGRDVWMMHNGVINIKSSNPEDKDKSDTVIFMEYIVRPILAAAPDLLHTHAFHQLVGEYTSGSRLLFLDDTGKIMRTGTWHVVDGLACSNNSYFNDTWSASRGGSGYGSCGIGGDDDYASQGYGGLYTGRITSQQNHNKDYVNRSVFKWRGSMCIYKNSKTGMLEVWKNYGWVPVDENGVELSEKEIKEELSSQKKPDETSGGTASSTTTATQETRNELPEEDEFFDDELISVGNQLVYISQLRYFDLRDMTEDDIAYAMEVNPEHLAKLVHEMAEADTAWEAYYTNKDTKAN